MEQKPISVDMLPLEVASQAFAALGSEARLDVLRTLVRAGPAGLPMGALAERTGTGASTLTHHIRFLAQAGLVTQEKQGRSIICSAVAFDRIKALSEYLLQECCADAPNCKPKETDNG